MMNYFKFKVKYTTAFPVTKFTLNIAHHGFPNVLQS